MSEVIFTVLSIVLIDLVLGGDNAVVIAMASRSLPLEQRKRAVYWGTAGAVILRFVFASVATVLLGIPYLMLAGGLLLTWIAYKLLVEDNHHDEVAAGKTIADAVRTIIIADAVMSLDNALAVAGVARGHIGWLAFGIALSVPIIVFGSQFIAKIMNNYPIVVYIGAGVLAWTAGHLIAEDPTFLRYIGEGLVVPAGIFNVLLVLTAGYLMNKRRSGRGNSSGNENMVPS